MKELSKPRQLALVLCILAGLGLPQPAAARNWRPAQIPNGNVFSCSTCHFNPGGGGPRNLFGRDVEAITGSSANPFWSPTLAAKDSDADGFSNGQELGDPDGDGVPAPGAQVTRPGDANSKPAVNLAPAVSIVAPAAGAVLTLPAVLSLEAAADDTDGAVTQVKFFDGATLLGTLRAAPFTLTVELGLGSHSLAAEATDDEDATTASSPVSVTVNAAPPVSISQVTLAGDELQLAWEGGGGPFAIQRKAALTEPWRSVGSVVTERSTAVQIPNAAAFIQVVDLAGQHSLPLSAWLSGAAERPNPVTTTATGSGTLQLEGNTLKFAIQYDGLSGPANAAHLHGPATAAESAGVLVNLAPFNGGSFGSAGTVSGSVVLTADQKAAVLSGLSYVNFHTAANPTGEIRGQIAPALMLANLTGAAERPNPVVTSASGTGHLRLAGNQLTFNVTYRGLSGTATAAHLHGPATPDEPAGVLVDLAPFNGGAFGAAGSLAGTVTLSDEQLAAVVDGLTYLNIHTAANGAGEIRGQVLPCVTSIPLSVSLNGAAERPDPVATTATGSGTLRLEGNTLAFDLYYTGLSGPASGAHIHGPASDAQTAGVLVNLAPFNAGAFGSSGTLSGAVVLTPAQRTAILGGQSYVNLHTEAHPTGEIRGQILP